MTFWNMPSITPKQAYRWYISFGKKNLQESSEVEDNVIPQWVCKKITKPSYQIKHTEHKYLGVHRFNYPTNLVWQPIQLTLVDVYGFKDFNFKTQRKDIDRDPNNNISIDNNTGQAVPVTSILPEEKTPYLVKSSTQLFFYYFLRDAGYIDPNEGTYSDALFRFTRTLTKDRMVGAFIGDNQDYLRNIRSNSPNTSFIDQKTWNTLDINEIDDLGIVTEKWRLYSPLITGVKFGELAYETEGVVDITVDLVYDWAELVPVSKDELDKNIKQNKNFIEKQKKDEQKEKVRIFDEIQSRYNINEKALREKEIKLSNNSIKNFEKIKILRTFVEHKKYSKVDNLTAEETKRIEEINDTLKESEKDKKDAEKFKSNLATAAALIAAKEETQRRLFDAADKAAADKAAADEAAADREAEAVEKAAARALLRDGDRRRAAEEARRKKLLKETLEEYRNEQKFELERDNLIRKEEARASKAEKEMAKLNDELGKAEELARQESISQDSRLRRRSAAQDLVDSERRAAEKSDREAARTKGLAEEIRRIEATEEPPTSLNYNLFEKREQDKSIKNQRQQADVELAAAQDAKKAADEKRQADADAVNEVIQFLKQDTENKRAEAEASKAAPEDPEKRRQLLERALINADRFNK